MNRALVAAVLAFLPTLAAAGTLDIQPVTDGVWVIAGGKEQRSAANLANNATFGLLETEKGAVLIDPGGSWKGAEAPREAIGTVTDQSVTYVINTGGQDHRWLGNGYWQARGAIVIASEAAVEDQQARGSMQMTGLSQLIGDALDGTEPSCADVTFADRHTLDLGDLKLAIVHPGAAHTPGDSFVWEPKKSTVSTVDIVYVERILGVGDQSSIGEWPAAFEAVEATGAAHVVPGHGRATTMERARVDTYDYLVNLPERIGALIEAGGGIPAAPKVDQSAFAHIEQFEALAGRNAQTAYQQMERE